MMPVRSYLWVMGRARRTVKHFSWSLGPAGARPVDHIRVNCSLGTRIETAEAARRHIPLEKGRFPWTLVGELSTMQVSQSDYL